MKTFNYAIVIAVLACFFGCKSGNVNPKFLTVINADGTCYKQIESTADSAFMVGDTAKNNPFGVDLDSSWKISWSYVTPDYKNTWPLKTWENDTINKNEVIKVKALRNYSSVEQMAREFSYSKQKAWHSIKPAYTFSKKFRWFYTYYCYSEVYPKLKTFEKIPFEKYLSKEEAEFWFNGNSALIKGMNGIEIKDLAITIEDKFNKWFEHNIWEEEMSVLIENYQLLEKPPVSRNQIIAEKDSLFEIFRTKQNDKDESNKELKNFLDNYYKTKAFSALYNKPGNPVKAYEDSLNKKDFLGFYEEWIDYNLLLPGQIIEADNALQYGDTLKFNLDAYRMTYTDYEIKATSRKTNTWAFWVTGIIMLLAIGSYFVKRR